MTDQTQVDDQTPAAATHAGTDQIAEALAAAQAEMVPAKKDAENPFFRSTYADLAAVIAAVKPLSLQDIAWIQAIDSKVTGDGKILYVTCQTNLYHSSGQRIEGATVSMPVKDPTSPQAIGSAITYAKRYSLAATCGVSTEDDDGEAAEGRPQQPQQPAKRSDWKQAAQPAAEKIMKITESKAGGTWGIKTNSGEYLTQDAEVATQLEQAQEAGIDVVIAAKPEKIGTKTIRRISHVTEVVV